jgi:hypothetical protein
VPAVGENLKYTSVKYCSEKTLNVCRAPSAETRCADAENRGRIAIDATRRVRE